MTYPDLDERPFDYVIIGGGSAGCVLANRLSASSGNRVLLIEAGVDTPPDAVPPEIAQAEDIIAPLAAGDRYIWPDLHAAFAGGTQPHNDFPHNNLYEQGRVLGGGSSINVMAANRGVPRDYDEWEAAGATGWGWEGVLPYFRKLERDLEFAGPLHGTSGPIPISRVPYESWPPFVHAAAGALREIGYQDIGDINGRYEDGFFRPGMSNEDNRRVSTAIGYLDAAVRRRPNLTILTRTRVTNILIPDGRARGVRLSGPAGTRDVAAGEVILAAGALQSPAFLLRAGIGPADDLQRLGIPVRADLPGVGANLQDHPNAFFLAPLAAEDAASPWRGPGHYLAARTSSGVDPAVLADLFVVFGTVRAANAFAQLGYWINKPSSRGRVTLRDGDPLSYPDVDFNLLSDARDVARFRAGARFISTVISRRALTGYALRPFGLPVRLRLGAAARTDIVPQDLTALLADDNALDAYLRQVAKGLWHASGTARIGSADDRTAVVDAAGRVFGVAGLRVADASVFPTIPAANINLPTIMVAEKIADAILADSRH